MSDKIKLQVWVKKEVVEELWGIIKQKYTRPHGALSLEVEHALVDWIRKHHAQIHTRPINPSIPRSHQIASDIVQYLKRKGYVNQASLGALKEAVIAIRGSDPRTIRKWIQFLVDNGFIKPLGTYLFEIL